MQHQQKFYEKGENGKIAHDDALRHDDASGRSGTEKQNQ